MDPIRNTEPQLRELERRGYWNWVATSLLLGGLCLCVVVLFVAQEAMSQLPDPGTGIIFVVGLCGSIALFSFYVLHKQRAIGRLRTRLFEAQIHEAQLLRARETAMETARLKSEVLSQISREIRTPMTGILGAVEILLEGELTPRQSQLLRTSKACAEALTGLLNDILDLSKIDPQKFELEKIPFNLRDCVATAIRPLTARARQKGLELACHVAVGVPDQLAGDPGRIRQLINILVGNAIKFTQRGEVVVRVEAESEMDRNVILRFSVTDTGPGIPTESQQAVFGSAAPADGSTLGGPPAKQGLAEPGTTGTVARAPGAPTPADASTPRKPEPTGIGLALASQLLTMMGGHIGVESELRKGSTFWFTARFTLQTHPSLDRARRPSVDLKGRRVLVVDDNATNQWIFVEMVEGWGMQTVAVAGAEAAVEVLKQARLSGTAFDLALLDLSLPGAEGLAPAARIKAEPELADVPLVVLTSAAQPGDARRCRDLGIAGYLPKPVMGSDLLGAMPPLAAGEPQPAPNPGGAERPRTHHRAGASAQAARTPRRHRGGLHRSPRGGRRGSLRPRADRHRDAGGGTLRPHRGHPRPGTHYRRAAARGRAGPVGPAEAERPVGRSRRRGLGAQAGPGRGPPGHHRPRRFGARVAGREPRGRGLARGPPRLIAAETVSKRRPPRPPTAPRRMA